MHVCWGVCLFSSEYISVSLYTYECAYALKGALFDKFSSSWTPSLKDGFGENLGSSNLPSRIGTADSDFLLRRMNTSNAGVDGCTATLAV